MKNTQAPSQKSMPHQVDPIRSAAAKQAAITRKNNLLRQQQAKWRLATASRAVFFTAFAALVFIGISHLVRATSLTPVPNDNGIPTSWNVVTTAHPESMTIPITYFDQNYDCQMFEFSHCNNVRDKSGGWTPNIIKDTLGSDGLPVPANVSSDNSLTPTSKYVTGHDPVVSTDNFYQWFHEVDGKSTKYERELTFSRVGDENKYTYGGRQIFPLDDVATAQKLENHNFHFTAHMQTPIKVSLSGSETFDFSGDDDVWVFLNGHLVLDIGGVHTAIDGSFTINQDGTVSSKVFEGKKTYSETTYDLGLAKDQIVNLDLFYAERNTSQANTLITITDMEWLISTASALDEELIENKLVQYTASVKNLDASSEVTLEKVSAHIVENGNAGFVPLSADTLSYSSNPSSSTSWDALPISQPSASSDGFQLDSPITLAPAGQSGDTAYVRFYASPEVNDVDMDTTVSFFMTNDAGDTGITHSTKSSSYRDLSVIEPEYTVAFNSDGGTPVPSQTVTRNLTATRPSDPDYPKHIFTGWYLGDESYDFDSPITQDITLTAHWEAIPDEEYIVAFDSDGGTDVPSQTVTEHGFATEPADPVKQGYEFKGWKLETEYYDFESEVVKSITLVAQWEKVDFLVIFDPDGGSMVAPQTVHKGNVAYQPVNSLRDGYTFVEWQLNGEPYNFNTPVTDDILLVAKWEKIIVPPPTPVTPDPEPEPEPEPEPTPEPEPEPEPQPTPEPEPTPEPQPEPTPQPTPEPEVVPNPTVAPAQDPVRVIATAERLIYDQTTDESPMVAFLPVLGAVSYAPNTGRVTYLSSNPLGNQSFSDIVLSQPFLIVTLAIFSLSFAIYYPLRKRKE